MRSELGRIWPTAKSAGVIGARQLRRPVRGANSDSPSEPSLANSGAIRSDGRKNPSAYP